MCMRVCVCVCVCLRVCVCDDKDKYLNPLSEDILLEELKDYN